MRRRPAGPGPRPAVRVYTREVCGLCRKAEEIVVRVAAGRADVELVDIDRDGALKEAYDVRVPVIELDGVEIAQYELDPRLLDSALRRIGV